MLKRNSDQCEASTDPKKKRKEWKRLVNGVLYLNQEKFPVTETRQEIELRSE